jgi:hypothetical protein
MVQVDFDCLLIQGQHRTGDFFPLRRIEHHQVTRYQLDIHSKTGARQPMNPLRVMLTEGLPGVERQALPVTGTQAVECEFQTMDQGTVTHGKG